MYNNAQSRLADIIYGSQTEQAGCDEWQSRITMEKKRNAQSLKHVQLLFPFIFFLYYAYPILLNDRLCRISFSLLRFSLC